jgi:uncharacterized protein (TIGR02300 family)
METPALETDTLDAIPARGLRRRCSACAAPFYDLRRDPIVCPKCGVEQVPILPSKRARVRPTPTGVEPVITDEPETKAEKGDEDETGDDEKAEVAEAGDTDEDEADEDEADEDGADKDETEDDVAVDEDADKDT